jgi:hypothetical protein
MALVQCVVHRRSRSRLEQAAAARSDVARIGREHLARGDPVQRRQVPPRDLLRQGEIPQHAPDRDPALGDKLVETFFTISPWINDPETDPNYSEQDFEYMPNGGWGQGDTSTLWLTSWETATLENTQSNQVAGDQSGWKRLLLQVDASGIRYYIDGALLCTHDAAYVPETDQHLDFNLWFDELAAGQTAPRTYAEDVDWVYFAKDVLLSQAEVDAQMAGFRASSIALVDTLP